MSVESVLKKLVENFNVGPSGWTFETSAGASVTVGTPMAHIGLNAEGGAIFLARGQTHVRLIYGGVGGSAGLSLVPSPINISFSLPQMPNAGVVYRLPCAGRSVDRSELTGACVLVEVGADGGPGGAGSMMFMGGSMLFASAASALTASMGYLPALLATSNAVVFFGGLTATLLPFNVWASVYIGMISDS